jgi:hypothetical protein
MAQCTNVSSCWPRIPMLVLEYRASARIRRSDKPDNMQRFISLDVNATFVEHSAGKLCIPAHN